MDPIARLLALTTRLVGPGELRVVLNEVREAAIAAHEHFRVITDSLAVGVARCSREWRYLWVNRAYAEWLGRSPEEIAGRPILEIIDPGAYQAVRPHIEKVLTGQKVESEGEQERSGQGLRRTHTVYTPTHDAEGVPDGWIAVVTDITERKRSEAALGQSEQQLHAVFENAASGMVLVSAEGKILKVNGSMERFFGWSRAELLGQPIELLLPERFGASHVGLRADFMVSPEARPMGHGRDLWGRRKDGTEFPVEVGLSPIHNGEGAAVFANVIDITARKQAEEALRLQAAALDSAANAIVITNDRGIIQWINPAFTRLTGYSAQEAVGQTPRLVRSNQHGEAFYRQMWETILAGQIWHDEVVNRRKDGSLYTEEMTITPVTARGQITHFVAIKQDITRRKQAEEALRQSEQLLRSQAGSLEDLVQHRTVALAASLRSIEDLLYTITHDLRAPNRNMQGLATILLKDHADQLDEPGRRYLQQIGDAALRNDGLIGGLLEYGRLSHTELPREPLNLGEVVEAVLESLAFEIRSRKAVVHTPKEWPVVLGARQPLERAIANLVSNALKFVARRRRPELRFTIQKGEGTPPSTVQLRLRDNGIGIPPEHRERIWLPFQRLHPVERYPGTGIGLAIVRKAVERMGGQTSVESEPGKGSEFTIELLTASGPQPLA